MVVEQCQQVDFCGAQVDEGGLQIGFVLETLEFKAVEIDLGDIAGLKAVRLTFRILS